MVTESEFLEMEEQNTSPEFGDTTDDGDLDLAEPTEDGASSRKTDNVGEASVEIDVESLVAEFEAEADDGVDKSGRVRRRLEAILERKRRHAALMDFDDYDIDS
jgi:hypothetical protein